MIDARSYMVGETTLMVQALQRGRLNQVTVHNLDMRMCFQLKFWSWYIAIMKTTFHIMEIT